jgi:hypothetical protein
VIEMSQSKWLVAALAPKEVHDIAFAICGNLADVPSLTAAARAGRTIVRAGMEEWLRQGPNKIAHDVACVTRPLSK